MRLFCQDFTLFWETFDWFFSNLKRFYLFRFLIRNLISRFDCLSMLLKRRHNHLDRLQICIMNDFYFDYYFEFKFFSFELITHFNFLFLCYGFVSYYRFLIVDFEFVNYSKWYFFWKIFDLLDLYLLAFQNQFIQFLILYQIFFLYFFIFFHYLSIALFALNYFSNFQIILNFLYDYYLIWQKLFWTTTMG
jgi:hypothetical protein